ncbi:hypothetical protein [Dyadobacter sp. OTU695]|uniref:hypothetical protein n=1 Tax=Dyadobacter sp. OTU695 TaxID=3043860 RepID=UPI00313C7CC8
MKVVISNGVGFYESPFTFNTTPDTDPFTGDQLGIADINGDGKSDIYHGWQIAAPSNFDVYYGKGYSSTGVNFYCVNSTYAVNLGAPLPMIGDFNCDHRADTANFKIINVKMDLFYFKKEGRENLLEKVKTATTMLPSGFTRSSRMKTASISGEISPLTHSTRSSHRSTPFPISNCRMGSGGINTIQYNYEASKLQRTGKGFLGFGKITANDLATGIKTISENEFNTTYCPAV